MTGRRTVLRLARVLVNEACQRLPADAREDREREWTAELAAIIDDPAIHRRWRRHLRALRFAVAQRRTVRRLTRPAGAKRVRVIVVRTALASAGAAAVLAVAAIVLDPVVSSSSSYSYPALQAEALAETLALAAGLLCAILLASLGMARAARSLWPRRPAAHAADRPAARAARTTRVARTAFVAGVLAFTGAAVAGTLSTAAHNPSAIGSVLGVAASLSAMAGGACLVLAVVLALAAAMSRLWRLNRRIQGPAGRAESPHGPASPAGEPPS